MYGGSGKLGRGGGGGRTGGNSRKSYPPPSAVRPPGRLAPVGGPRNRLISVNPSKPESAAAALAVDEQFSLVPGSNPLAFAMIIKLTPGLVEEIRKVEAQGGNARIKFDANANNTSGNVIDVGGKDFRFTWSREMGGLCDIYEERKSGEAGNGLLVETSCAWRKLNVQRVLDETTTSQVKMRSVEAELKHKSRQAIILDHGNPSTKNQMKAPSNPFRNSYKQKKEPPFKKRKIGSSPGGGPSRLLSQKHALPSSASVKSTRSPSPLLSTPNRLGGSLSPYGPPKFNKNSASIDDPKHTQSYNKVDWLISEKEGASKAAHVTHGNKGKRGANPTDLESMIVSLLTDNLKGMTVKALETAVGDAFSNASKDIELIVGSIATFQPSSGRYILKQGTNSECSKDPLSMIEGSHEHNHNQRADKPDHTHHLSSTQEANFADKLFSEENQSQEQLRSNSLEDSTAVEKNAIIQNSDISGHPRSPNKSDGQAGSYSNSGSDSDIDTDSSDSESDSQSKSKSPVVSGSSSDSDSDATTNSKEASDEDVDIISEDDKEQKVKLVASGQGFSSSPVPWRTSDGRPSQNCVYSNEEYFGTVEVEVEKILPGEDEDIEIDVVSDAVPYENNKSKVVCGIRSPIHDEHHEHESYGRSSLNNAHNVVKDQEKISSPLRVSKGKSKSKSIRGFDASMDQKSDSSKSSKPGNLPPHPNSGSKNTQASEASDHFSPQGLESDLFMDSLSHLMKRSDRNDDDQIRRPKGSIERQPGLMSNNQPPSAMHVNQKRLENMSNCSNKHKVRDNMGLGSKISERNSQANIDFSSQCDKLYGDALNEDIGIGSNNTKTFDSQYKRPEAVRLYNGAQQVSKTSLGSLPKDDDRYPFISGQGKILHRELSDLEMGELRETVPEEPLEINKKSERERSFKKVKSKQGISDGQNIYPIESKPVTVKPTEQEKVFSPPSLSRAQKNPEWSSKKRTTEKTKRHRQRTTDLQTQSHLNFDPSAKTAPCKKHDDRNRQVSQANANDSADLIDVETDALLPDQKRRESSSDENSCSFTKYEKNEPDLRGPIKDVSEYQECVQEYNAKYDSYSSLNKIIESYRNDFLKLGMELESAKGKDEEKYNDVMSRLIESYRQYGARHKRLKKIFVVLHEELQQLKEMMKDFATAYTRS